MMNSGPSMRLSGWRSRWPSYFDADRRAQSEQILLDSAYLAHASGDLEAARHLRGAAASFAADGDDWQCSTVASAFLKRFVPPIEAVRQQHAEEQSNSGVVLTGEA